jgi:hypothetical protein
MNFGYETSFIIPHQKNHEVSLLINPEAIVDKDYDRVAGGNGALQVFRPEYCSALRPFPLA